MAPLRAAVVAAAIALTPGAARAADPCSVVRKCSATGLACTSSDRKCEDEARYRGLEVVCDVQIGPEEKQLVYCPPITEQRDSKVVWLLLGVAMLLAVGGGTVLLFVIRKP